MSHSVQSPPPHPSAPSSRTRSRRDCAVGLAFLVALSALASSACTHVAPYDRGRLAHPMMTGDVQTAAAGHVTSVQEGSTGGGSVAESGCGCN